jgi:hypothetical protein
MNRRTAAAALFTCAGIMTAWPYDLAAIIARVSENCDKIVSYNADAQVNYQI